MSVKQRRNVAYGFSEPLLNISPFPIISQRAPTVSDKAEIGSIWVDQPNNDAYVITSIVNNEANWVGIGGGSGSFTNIVATGTITSGGSITTQTGDVNASAGSINASSNLTAGDTILAVNDIISSNGSIVSAAGNIEAQTVGMGLLLNGDVLVTAGAGAPTLTAPAGSLYLRTDPANAATRAYINLIGTNTWTNITCAA